MLVYAWDLLEIFFLINILFVSALMGTFSMAYYSEECNLIIYIVCMCLKV